MIPILHNGRLIWCGPTVPQIHQRHCPACGDLRQVAVVWAGHPSRRPGPKDLVGCPVCGSTKPLWRLLDRRQG